MLVFEFRQEVHDHIVRGVGSARKSQSYHSAQLVALVLIVLHLGALPVTRRRLRDRCPIPLVFLRIHDLVVSNFFAISGHLERVGLHSRVVCLNIVHELKGQVGNLLQEGVLLGVRDGQVLAVTGLRLEDDLYALEPLELLAEEHDIVQVAQSPQIGQFEQLLQRGLVSVQNGHKDEDLLVDLLRSAISREVALMPHAKTTYEHVEQFVMLQTAC
mmetsp:Transcript_634/g.854  ORF Transcript_634/g.854 Transcript_634/m.854 type:complete len:215 (-) Transcript_634:1302-1946(-)